LTSYAIGRVLPQTKTTSRALVVARRYGAAALLLSWVPAIGDALCIASGWLRHDVRAAAVFMALGKLARYIVVAYAARAIAA
jgi:membrane protein YqaA with SNARE-associated domain